MNLVGGALTLPLLLPLPLPLPLPIPIPRTLTCTPISRPNFCPEDAVKAKNQKVVSTWLGAGVVSTWLGAGVMEFGVGFGVGGRVRGWG